MTQKLSNVFPSRNGHALSGIPIRSHLRAGTVLQVDIPAITAVQQEAQTPAATTTTTATATV